MDQKPLSHLTDALISTFEEQTPQDKDKKISVNPVVSKVASIYEKVRNAMDYRDQEVILRAAIERILKRRAMFGGTDGKKIAEPLVKELVWARYFPDESLSESVIGRVEKRINIYLQIRERVIAFNKLPEKTINEWIFHLMSSDIEHMLSQRKRKEAMTNFMFNIMRKNIEISDQPEQITDIQVYIAVHKAFAHDDLALLRYNLFKQFFGEPNEETVEYISNNFTDCVREINAQLKHPRKDKIVNYVKDKSVVFFTLQDLLNIKGIRVKELYHDEKEFQRIVASICQARYSGISAKVRTAIIRSIIFLLLTKAFFAIAIEGTYESLVFGEIIWRSTIINIVVPPTLMAIVALFIRTPDRDNTKRIFHYVRSILVENDPMFNRRLSVKVNPDKTRPVLNSIFSILWIVTFLGLFSFMVYILNLLDFNILSIGVFMFFLIIVSFLSYRINQTANMYSIEKKKTPTTSITDFLFIPFVKVGRRLTEGITQINIFLFVLDFLFEAPFKGLFGFFEEWFLFLQNKREELE